MKIFKNGFTLAEILITLSIIGIIAALLIPQLVDNTKKNQYGMITLHTLDYRRNFV